MGLVALSSPATRIGLLGGTFDPVHSAHVALARLFFEVLELDQVRFIPAGNPWQKDRVEASGAQRVHMLESALAAFELPCSIDARELQRSGASYTVDTLESLRAELGGAVSLVLLMGADQLDRFHTWHRWRDIFGLAHLGVAGRPGYSLAAAALDPEVALEVARRLSSATALHQTPAGRVVLVPADLGPVSSSIIRERLHLGDLAALNGLVPNSVLDYIRDHHLYSR